MTDLVLTDATTALVTWATTTLAESGRNAVSSLIALIRRRFQPDPSAREIVAAALHPPLDQDAVRQLAELLEREATRDPGFGEQFRAHWLLADEAVKVDHSGVVNSVSGDVAGSIVQARDIHGGVSFGSDRPDRR